MARISLDPPRTPLLRFGEWYSRRRYGAVLDPGKAYGHNTKVLLAYWGFERKVAKWDGLDAGLKHLAVMAAAAKIGCAWCMDFGAFAADGLGLPADKVRRVPRRREERSSFTELECLAMEYAEAVTDTPPTRPTSWPRNYSAGWERPPSSSSPRSWRWRTCAPGRTARSV